MVLTQHARTTRAVIALLLLTQQPLTMTLAAPSDSSSGSLTQFRF